MNKIKKIMIILVLLLCVMWSGAQVGLAQSVDSPTTGGVRFKVSEDTTSDSSDTNKPSDNNSNGNSNDMGDDSGKDLSKNSVDPIPNKSSRKSSSLPNMGEIALRSLPIIGIIVIVLAIYLFMKRKKNKEN